MTAQTATEDSVDKELEKEVVMVGYYDEMSIDMDRFKTRVTGVDLETTKTERDEIWEAVIDLSDILGGNSVVEHTFYLEDDKERAVERMKEEGIWHLATVDHNITTEQSKVNSEYQAQKKLRKELFSDLPDELPPNLVKEAKWGKYQTPEGSTKTRVKNPDFDKRRILAKESEREPGNMYETTVNCLSVSFEIKLKANSQELIDKYTDEVIVPLHKALAKRDGIGKVRYTSCTTKEEKHGECFM